MKHFGISSIFAGWLPICYSTNCELLIRSNISSVKSSRRKIAAAALGLLLASCRFSFALDPSLDVSQYVHTAWKVRDGFAKGEITSISQARDGYIWLGTDFGLLHFDGVREVPWEPPEGQHLPSNRIY